LASEYFYAPIPEARFRRAWRAASGEENAVRPGEFRRVRPEGARWRALLDTLATIRRQAETAPATWNDPLRRDAMERSLLNAIVLAVAADQERPCPASPRGTAYDWPVIVRRAQEYLRAHADEPVYVLDLCAATGVSERTLRSAFLAQCGMGPIRYLKLRRLHQVRQALRASSSAATSVKAVGLANGFWDLGRFAIEYHRLFGESPSATLRA
jgi:AraC-like DNA-binding protein